MSERGVKLKLYFCFVSHGLSIELKTNQSDAEETTLITLVGVVIVY